MKKCPICGSENRVPWLFDGYLQCDCGYEFGYGFEKNGDQSGFITSVYFRRVSIALSIASLVIILYFAKNAYHFWYIVWAILSVQAKRCHDLDISAWFILTNYTVVGIPIILSCLVFIKGTNSPNKFG